MPKKIENKVKLIARLRARRVPGLKDRILDRPDPDCCEAADVIVTLRKALIDLVHVYRYDLSAPEPPALIAARAALYLVEGA
jgi:hypothetical protein